MKRNIIVSIFIVLLLVIGSTFFIEENNNEVIADAVKLKEDYEALNYKTIGNEGTTYKSVSISENAPINIINVNESLKLIEQDTGILFIGAKWCPSCRNALPILIDVASKNNLTINYLDITDIRNVWALEKGKLIKIQEEQDGYYELLDALDEILDDKTYKLVDSKNKKYDTKEKRISMPTVIVIKNGKIIEYHVGTVEIDEENRYDELTSKQEKELLNIYENMIKDIID